MLSSYLALSNEQCTPLPPIIIISSTPATTPSVTSADTIGRAKLLKQSLRLIRDKIKTEKNKENMYLSETYRISDIKMNTN